jgi:hypothetical protein
MEWSGANFMDFSNNIRYNIPLDSQDLQFVTPRIGFGFSVPPWDGTAVSINYGLSYKIWRMEFGIDVASYFMNGLLSEYTRFVDILILSYPSVKYYIINKKKSFLNAGAGILIPYERYSRRFYLGDDIIPFVNITTGMVLDRKNNTLR